MNYLIPVSNLYEIDKDLILQYAKEDFEDVLTQQIVISQLSNGISYKDTEDMDEYERIYIFKKLIQMKKDENQAKLDALKNQNK